MIEKSFDEIILERLKRSALGRPYSDGRPVSKLDQLLAQAALTSRAVLAFGGRSLFSVVQELQTEAMRDERRADLFSWNMWSPGGAAVTYFSSVMNDIASGRLVVREPLCFLRCNDLPEIQMLPNLCEGFASMEILVRYAVKKSEVASWLKDQGLAVPDWLQPAQCVKVDPDRGIRGELPGDGGGVEKSSADQNRWWSDELPDGRVKLRQQFDAIQMEIEARGYIPTNIPHGGISIVREACESGKPKLFNAKSSFDNAWRELVEMGKTRSYNHSAYGGKAR